MQYFPDVAVFSPIQIAAAVFLLLLTSIYYARKNRGLPPGPTGLPYLGFWPFLDCRAPLAQFEKLAEKYGDVFSMTVMGQLVINLGSIRAMKEFHVSKSECFNSRPRKFVLLDAVFGGGMTTLNGEASKIMRRFFVQAFKGWGMTSVKDDATSPYSDCLTHTVEDILANQGKPVDMTNILLDRCSTIMRGTLFANVGTTDEELRELYEAYGEILSTFTTDKSFLFGDLARRFVYPLSSGYRHAKHHREHMMSILHDIVRRHESTFEQHRVRNLVDSYIQERNDRLEKQDSTARYFTADLLASTLLQAVGDGILSVAGYIAVFLGAVLDHPDEQDRIRAEVLEVIGPDRLPSWEDRGRLPYTGAFMLEVVRTTDFTPWLPSAMCTDETKIRGYRIPRGAVTLANYWCANHHPGTYEDPASFSPSRFLADPGKAREENPLIFGVGKRACIGELFSTIQVFLFLVTLVQKFRLSRPEVTSDPGPNVLFTPGHLYVVATPVKQDA